MVSQVLKRLFCWCGGQRGSISLQHSVAASGKMHHTANLVAYPKGNSILRMQSILFEECRLHYAVLPFAMFSDHVFFSCFGGCQQDLRPCGQGCIDGKWGVKALEMSLSSVLGFRKDVLEREMQYRYSYFFSNFSVCWHRKSIETDSLILLCPSRPPETLGLRIGVRREWKTCLMR